MACAPLNSTVRFHLSVSQVFKPANPLEDALVKAQSGAISITDFLANLIGSQVFVLLDKDPGPSGKWDNTASPLVVNSQTGTPMLVVFTAPERSTGWARRAPQYTFGLLTDFRWLLKGITSGVGLVINPGSTIGLEMPPSGVEQLRSTAAR
jgi:hypothetical protein